MTQTDTAGSDGSFWLMKWHIIQIVVTIASGQYLNRTATTCTFSSSAPALETRGFLRLDCEPSDSTTYVIRIVTAMYGISEHSACSFNIGIPDPFNTQPFVSTDDTCTEDRAHMPHIRECNGKEQCKIPTNAVTLECGQSQTVPSQYLQVEFQCIPGAFSLAEDNICGSTVFPDDRYDATDDFNPSDWQPPPREKRDAEDTLPHIKNSYYRVTNPSAFLVSPNFPHNYPNYMHCECYLQTYYDAYIVFRVLQFDIEEEISCVYDYLQMSIGPLNQRYCGPTLPKEETSSSFVRLVIRSDDSVSYRGLWAQFWGQREDGTRVPVRSKCGEYTGSNIPSFIPPFPGDPSHPDAVPVETPAPPVVVKPPPPTTRPAPPTTTTTPGSTRRTTAASSPSVSPSNASFPVSSGPDAEDEGGNSNISIIIGAAAAGGLLILVLNIIAIILCCRRREARKKLMGRPGLSASMSDMGSRQLPPAPDGPAPKLPRSMRNKGEEYLTLTSDHVLYKSPPTSGYTTLDSNGSSVHTIPVPTQSLQLKAPTAPPFAQFPVNSRSNASHTPPAPAPHFNLPLDAQDDHIYAEIYDEIAKYPHTVAPPYNTTQQSYTNSGYTSGARNNYQNYLNTDFHADKIHVSIINGSNS